MQDINQRTANQSLHSFSKLAGKVAKHREDGRLRQYFKPVGGVRKHRKEGR